METGDHLDTGAVQIGVVVQLVDLCKTSMEVLAVICSNPRDFTSELHFTINFLEGIVASIFPILSTQNIVIRMKWKLLKISQFLLKFPEKEILSSSF